MYRIQNEIKKLDTFNPFVSIDKEELDTILSLFITLIWLIKDKKMTRTTFFVEIMDSDVLKAELERICGFDDELELYKEILIRNPSICNSKFIKNKLKRKFKSDNIKTCSKSKKKYTTRT